MYALYVCIRYRETRVNYDYFTDLEARSQSSTLRHGPVRQKAINVLVDATDRILQEHPDREMQIRLTYDSSKLAEQFKLLVEGHELCLYILAMVTEQAIPYGLHDPTDLIEYAASLERALSYHYHYSEQNDCIIYTLISEVAIPKDRYSVHPGAVMYLQFS